MVMWYYGLRTEEELPDEVDHAVPHLVEPLDPQAGVIPDTELR